MNGEPQEFHERFVDIVGRLDLLSAADAWDLVRDAQSQGLSLIEAGVRKSLISAANADVISTLLQPEQIVPGYEIEELVGRGGMGTVYRARQISLDRIVAIKMINASLMNDDRTIQQFEREARTVASIRHPNIVDALDFGKHDGRWFFVMEYVDGPTASETLAGFGRFSEQITWSIVRQAAAGLSQAMHQNVMHHDIKPDNLLLLRPPEGYPLPTGVPMVKIADFGLAYLNQVDADAVSGSKKRLRIAGSPPYMAPELFQGRAPNQLSDIYSLGVTALELMTAENVFKFKSTAEGIEAKRQPNKVLTTERFPHLSERTMNVLKSMIAADPDNRPADYEAVKEATEELSAERSTVSSGVDDETAFDFSDQTLFPSSSGRPVARQRSTMSKNSPTVLVDEVPLSHGTETGFFASRRVLLSGLLICVLAGAAAILFGLTAMRPTTGATRVTNVEQTNTLFDGSTLSGFSTDQTSSGPWQVLSAPDNTPSFTCSGQGAIDRKLPDWEIFRVTIFVNTSELTEYADIAFEFPGEHQVVVRCMPDRVMLGTKQSDFGEFTPIEQEPMEMNLNSRFHVLNIERQKHEWLIFFEEQQLGRLPLQTGNGWLASNPETEQVRKLRLAVKYRSPTTTPEDNAYFSELFVEQLVE